MSSKVIPDTNCFLPSTIVRKSIRKACGPLDFPSIIKSAITTLLSATNPWDIQFFFAPSLGVRSTNCREARSYSAKVSTIRPELTPANFSVRPKQPSCCFSCIASSCATCSSPPTARTVPAKRLNCTVRRVQKPMPRLCSLRATARCASKNHSGSSLSDVWRNSPRPKNSRISAADSSKVGCFPFHLAGHLAAQSWMALDRSANILRYFCVQLSTLRRLSRT
mmetsp:Transcript_63881/g.169744  ORF Transcript_63881/g.169744 Transcript_63881/m.169744 type:complete len:222 (-) Transcript_63881:2-667(-)